MRKTYVFHLGLCAIMLFSMQRLQAQRGNLSVGLVPTYKADGYGIQAQVNYDRSTTDHLQVALAATFSKEQPNAGVEFPYHDYLLNLGYFTTIITAPTRGFFFYFGGGPSLGYKHINNGSAEFAFDASSAESSLIYGGYASVEMDFFISDAFSLIVPLNCFYHFNSSLNETTVLLGAGIRYYFK